MLIAVSAIWAAASLGFLLLAVAARRRRAALASELHELRGALTGARLAVDLMPVLGVDRAAVCQAASEELKRSYFSLGDFEDLLHAELLPRPSRAVSASRGLCESIRRRSRFDAMPELERLGLIWAEAARREGRRFQYEWHGVDGAAWIVGSQRRFVSVLSNLISNALMHGEGDIRLNAKKLDRSLRIEVHDQGSGLQVPLASIVRRRSRARHGHGLGVAMRAADRLGGAVTSAPSAGGATLVFTLPALHEPSSLEALLGADPGEPSARYPLQPLGKGEGE